MEKYLKRKKIYLNKGEQQLDLALSEDGEPGEALSVSPSVSPNLVAPVAAKKSKGEAAAKKKPASVRKSSRRSRSSMDIVEDDLFMDTPDVGLAEELIPEIPEETVETIEETVGEEKFDEIPEMGADLLVPTFAEEKPKKKPTNPSKKSAPVSAQHQAESEEDLVSPKLEVTGVSRSGRVRKKSSKLTDFKSPDEIDPRYKRKSEKGTFDSSTTDSPAAAAPSTPKSKKSTKKAPSVTPPAPPPPAAPPVEEEFFMSKEELVEEEEIVFPHDAHLDTDSDTEIHHTEEVVEDDDHLSDDSAEGDHAVVHDELDEDEIDDDDDDEPQFVVDESPRPKQTNQAMSLYMMEKSRKKLVVKDGKVVGRQKAQRKDKGKTRYTAYMLWAKQARKDALKFDPDMDFSSTSKKLGEMWSLVPTSEKLSWRRRAKRLSAKQKLEEHRALAQGQQRKLKNTAPPPQPKPSPTKPKPDRRGQGQLNTLAAAAAVAQQQQQMQLSQQQQLQNALAAAASEVSRSPVKSSPGDPHAAVLFKPVTTNPVDVAAHLKLLGESLSNIGERLKEHEGQIAVSGSVSVLLDSLICAMGPLICLTQQIPEFNVCPQEQLAQILDNIAYIMPGL
ncbi:HMG box-containing protein 4 isoform X2 [Neocloeon triangulifer]|uniref:HMG box-containing protein 4 isoform X2 n=1 Tax=Neocloeon triangulifer TaxID=2078957 RepID=UPI00286F4901|nr:HMG box-containing protein 4 isoform X2 [Neocloeon triangulifer]